MKKLWLISFLLLALGTATVPALAQTTRIKTFTSSDGVFTFAYPGDWHFVGTKPTEATGKNADQTITAVITYPAVSVKGPSNTPLQYLQSAASDMAKYLTNPQVKALKIGAWDAARLDAASPQFGGITSFAVAYPDHLVSMMFLGKVEALQQADETLLAMVGSFVPVSKLSTGTAGPLTEAVESSLQPKGATVSTSSAQVEALTKTFTAGNGTFSMKYPAGWTAIDVDPGTVALRNSDGLIFVGGFPAGDASVAPRDYLGGLLGDATFTDLEVNGRPATRIDNSKTLRGGGGLLINFDGTYAYFNWIGTQEQIRKADATMMAMAQTFELNDEAVANTIAAEPLTKTLSGNGGAFSIMYPTDWTSEVGDNGIVEFINNDLKFFVAYPTGNATRLTPRDYLAILVQDGPITEFELNGMKAARIDNSEALNGGSAIMLEVNGKFAYFYWRGGTDEQRKQAEPTLMAMIDSFQVNISADDLAAGAADQLTETFTAANKAYSFKYPTIWTFKPINGGAAIAFSNADQSLNGQILYGQAGRSARQYLVDLVTGNGAPASLVQEFTLGGRSAAISSAVTDNYIAHLIGVDFDGGNVLIVAALGSSKAVVEAEPMLMALAASFQPAGSKGDTASSTPTVVDCGVSASVATNLRSGPGTTFAKAGSLAAGASASVTGQATGADGKVWYQLDTGTWVRSDLVASSGDCDLLPTITP